MDGANIVITEIKQKLIDNPIHIQNILEYYEFHNIDLKSHEIRCGINEKTNKTSIRIKLHNNQYLYVSDYGRGINCDFISFIIKSKNVEFKEVINIIKKELGIDSFYYYKKRKSVFGGFYNKIKSKNSHVIELKTYDDNILNQYLSKYNLMFFRDNISFQTQKKFKIGFDIISQRITCPWWSFEGDLIGITGRYIGDYEMDNTLKWCPVIPHLKSQTLYGYTENYQYLQGCEELYIFESEKGAMQLDSMDIYTGLALGGNSIHYHQIINIINLQPQKIILGMDEGLKEEIVVNQINKIKSMLKFKDIKVGYIIDKENKILPKESKMSPTDLGKEKFIELKNNYVEWV